MGDQELRSWVEDDFVETTSPQPLDETDPWDPRLPVAQSQAALSHREQMGYEPGATRATLGSHAAWDYEDELATVDPGEQWSEVALEPPSDWVEPDPTIDASSELSEALYPPDESITDISRELKIRELLARIEPITSEQRARCHGLLAACGIGRLRRWIPWLGNRHWSGPELQLFLEFRRHWESSANVRWWETFRWDCFQQEWMPSYQSGALTLDHGRELVERRAHCAVRDVVDPVWLAEWEAHAVWELGVRSFASFAVLRANVGDDGDWQEHLARPDERTPMEAAQCADLSFAPFMLPSYAQQYGFSGVLSTGLASRPEMVDTARRKAAMASGDLALSTQDLIDRLTGVCHA